MGWQRIFCEVWSAKYYLEKFYQSDERSLLGSIHRRIILLFLSNKQLFLFTPLAFLSFFMPFFLLFFFFLFVCLFVSFFLSFFFVVQNGKKDIYLTSFLNGPCSAGYNKRCPEDNV
jgi:hypothetical protein